MHICVCYLDDIYAIIFGKNGMSNVMKLTNKIIDLMPFFYTIQFFLPSINIIITNTQLFHSFRYLLGPFIPATLLLAIGLLLVMAEEFPQLPLSLRRLSTRLARATFGRKAFICALMAIISVPSMLTLVCMENVIMKKSSR